MARRFIYPVVNQNFSLSYSMMSHIRTYITPNIHSKLIQTCKLFFVKKPVVLVDGMHHWNNEIQVEYKKESKFTRTGEVTSKFWITESLGFSNPLSDWNVFSSFIFQIDDSFPRAQYHFK